MAQILLVGTATLDLVFRLDHHPEGDEEMRAQTLRTCRGGNAANTAVVLSRLGHAPAFLGVLADAPETAVIERDFEAHGVVFSCCPRLPGRPPTSSIYLSNGMRSIVHYRALPELEAAAFTRLDLAPYQWLHFEGRNAAELAVMLQHARQAAPGLPISLELEKPREGIEHVLGMAGWLFCSRGYARHCGYDDPVAFLTWLRGRVPKAALVVAWGEGGAYGTMAGASSIYHALAVPVAEVSDSLGAGDTFNAGLIDACLAQQDMQAALVRACALAGRKCQIEGYDL